MIVRALIVRALIGVCVMRAVIGAFFNMIMGRMVARAMVIMRVVRVGR